MQIILFKRNRITTALCLGAAAAILWMVCHPAAIGAAGQQRALPIYSVAVPGEEKVAAITFDAAWGDVRMRQSGIVPGLPHFGLILRCLDWDC